jgi:membrane protease YdiL (CAAX protease family)
MFTIVLAILFLCIYGLIGKKMGNRPVAMVLSLAFSLLIAVPITKRGLLESLFDESVVDILLIIGIIIFIMLFIIRFCTYLNYEGRRKVAWFRVVLFLLVLVVLAPFLKNSLPDSLYYGTFGDFMGKIESLGWAAIIIIIAIVFIAWLIRRMWWRGREYSVNVRR